MNRRKIGRTFYRRDTLKVARDLLSKQLVHEGSDGSTSGEITETEAYIGPRDRASHAYGGRRTPRIEALYGPVGHAYVFMIHGKCCFNITTGTRGGPEAVLIRALRPVSGIGLMANRRRIAPADPVRERDLIVLCNGPSRLCQAMGIDKKHDGIDLCDDVLYLERSSAVESSRIAATPRVGIDYAGEAKHFPWRFCLRDSEYVSKPVMSKETRMPQ